MQVVFGAAGRAGGAVAQALLERGLPVRVAVRRREQGEPWAARGAMVAIADLEDPASVEAALSGATAAFVLNPTPLDGDPYVRAAVVAASLKQALDRARPAKVVVLSSVGAQHATGVGVVATLNQMETALKDLPFPVAFLRPSYFLDSWSEFVEPVRASQGLPTFIAPDQRLPMVSTVDVGRAAAELMQEEWTGRRVIELAGPQDWTPREVAAAFATHLGQPVEPQFVPLEHQAAAMMEAGLPEPMAQAMAGLYAGIADGTAAAEPGTEQRRGAVGLDEGIGRLLS